MRAWPLAAVTLAAAAALAVSLASCGRSALAKAYDAYDASVEPLLAKEQAVLQRLGTFVNDWVRGENPDLNRFQDYLSTQAMPFYEAFSAKVHELKPGD